MVKVLAPAKINFTLDITGKLDNGYHTVDMVMQSVNLFDEVTVEVDKGSEINLTCNKEDIPCNSSNTAYKAVQLFAEKTGLSFGAKVHIEKNIPAQAGLAGGSTDGAAVLVALNKIFNTQITIDQLAEIGAKIGADVPFCLYGGTMLATGIGTDLKKIPHNFPFNDYYILLCKPNINVSTPQAYKLSDSRAYSNVVHSTAVISALEDNNIAEFCNGLYNDFDSLLMLEQVQQIKTDMLKSGALSAVMSGSGPTVYGIFNDIEKANLALKDLEQQYKDVYITQCCDYGCIVAE